MSFTMQPRSSQQQAADAQAADEPKRLQVFLGGSCNPTTWRQNVAIPYLELEGISYYNPQIDNWTPDVVDIERVAKQNAQILLFVIDRQTRSAVSLVESAFLVCEQSKGVVIVIYPFELSIVRERRSEYSSKTVDASSGSSACTSATQEYKSIISSNRVSPDAIADAIAEATLCTKSEQSVSSQHENAAISAEVSYEQTGAIKISGECISLQEFNELRRARCILQSLIKLHKIPIFSDIIQALKYARSQLCNDAATASAGLPPPPPPQAMQTMSCVETHETMCSSKTTTTTTTTMTSSSSLQSQTHTDLQQRISNNCHRHHTHRQYHRHHRRAASMTLQSGANAQSYLIKQQQQQQQTTTTALRDIYLTADSDDELQLESTVIPMLRASGLSFEWKPLSRLMQQQQQQRQQCALPPQQAQAPALCHNSSSNTTTLAQDASAPLNRHSNYTSDTLAEISETREAIERELHVIRHSRVLLFVITNKCRGLSIMVLASHFMALFRDSCVLCVQFLQDNCMIGGEKLTKTAIDDYNRGRVYLRDYAHKSQIPVFNTISEAIECCNVKCRHEATAGAAGAAASSSSSSSSSGSRGSGVGIDGDVAALDDVGAANNKSATLTKVATAHTC